MKSGGARRILAIGAPGAGKSWFADRLAAQGGPPAVSLDALFWADEGFSRPRPRGEAFELARAAAMEERWTIEGVQADLAAQAAPRAQVLVWLDPPLAVCLDRLAARRKPGETAASRAALIEWAGRHESRQGSASRSGHLALWESFGGWRLRCAMPEDVAHTLQLLLRRCV